MRVKIDRPLRVNASFTKIQQAKEYWETMERLLQLADRTGKIYCKSYVSMQFYVMQQAMTSIY